MARFSPTLRRLALTCALPALLTAPAAADPTFGIGLTFTFGGGTPQTGVGFRIFSDDEEDSAVGSIGLDYLFQDESWRGSVGVAYLGSNGYVGADVGFGFGDGNFSFGLGAGFVDTSAPPAGVAPPPPPQDPYELF